MPRTTDNSFGAKGSHARVIFIPDTPSKQGPDESRVWTQEDRHFAKIVPPNKPSARDILKQDCKCDRCGC